MNTDGHVLRYEIVRPEAPNSGEFPVFGNEQAGPPERRSRYGLYLPYTIVLRLGWGGTRGMVYFFASQPVAADRCAGFVLAGRNYNTGQPDRVIQEFEDTIFGQDQVVVESQRPERVPFDLAAELHLKFGEVAVAYRRAMRGPGLAVSTPIGTSADRTGMGAKAPQGLRGAFARDSSQRLPRAGRGGSSPESVTLFRNRQILRFAPRQERRPIRPG